MKDIITTLEHLLGLLFKPPYSNLIPVGFAFLLLAFVIKSIMTASKLTSRSIRVSFDILFTYIFGFVFYGINGTLSSMIRNLPFWSQLMEDQSLISMAGDATVFFAQEAMKMLVLGLTASLVGSLVEKNVREGNTLTALITMTLWKMVIVITGLIACLGCDIIFSRYLKGTRIRWTPVIVLIVLGILMVLIFLKILGIAAFLTGKLFTKIFGFFTKNVVGHTVSTGFASALVCTITLIVFQIRDIAPLLASGEASLISGIPSLALVLLIGFIVERFA